ncbi:hypothetical protein TraAM80_01611 [Trypanosoma rangeli]|uniref:Small RNA 2'-O-methyltransferase n=1 Tax=Trypanosoma rangeli TaxID=5698 RepID=A0A422NXT6_TRYRA|nr:uncharacterized protein TraAM80_01611 [Trypanosoma rangeli]RNF10268.1 hypothetical protein TraAM80_01611 [Trypanosoma rangeli]|eukprot:RNF10268.1 hypothetical protein TraAM80_01611 [Trypanosoma rangeli]
MELPFQWADGKFISPFVASSTDALEVLAAWVKDSLLFQLRRGGSLGLTDLGCGDGAALLLLSAALLRTSRGTSDYADVPPPLQLTLVGLDLDGGLVLTARRRAAAMAAPPPHRLHCTFETADVRHLEVERYFPCSEAGEATCCFCTCCQKG